MKEVDLNSWEEFEVELEKLRKLYDNAKKSSLYISPLLFRGHHDSGFQLTTTLERSKTGETSFLDYYGLISRAKHQIETFTGKTWEILPIPEFSEKAQKYDEGALLTLWREAYSYMIYLRHHGFPSPLLDWSRSPYVAAYFAFRSISKPSTGMVSIYVFWERPEGMKSGGSSVPCIMPMGPYVRSHKRHFLQQGEYTISAIFNSGEWYFEGYDKTLAGEISNQDVCWKFNIPWTERIKVLKLLDRYNLNAFSLFDSEESLMETMALRELSFREKNP